MQKNGSYMSEYLLPLSLFWNKKYGFSSTLYSLKEIYIFFFLNKFFSGCTFPYSVRTLSFYDCWCDALYDVCPKSWLLSVHPLFAPARQIAHRSPRTTQVIGIICGFDGELHGTCASSYKHRRQRGLSLHQGGARCTGSKRRFNIHLRRPYIERTYYLARQCAVCVRFDWITLW